jgi:hypothetical protein
MTTYNSGFRDFESPEGGDEPRSHTVRNTLIAWAIVIAVLATLVVLFFVLGVPDASAAGGCGGG